MKFDKAYVVVFADQLTILATDDLFKSLLAAEAGIVKLKKNMKTKKFHAMRLETYIHMREYRAEANWYGDGRHAAGYFENMV